jgi:hypothetical protein
VGSPFCWGGGGKPQGKPLSPHTHTLSAPTVSPIYIFVLGFAGCLCGVVSWCVRKIDGVIRVLFKRFRRCPGASGPFESHESYVYGRKVIFVLAKERQ